jgi:glycosyltransferase involved in cell wall biosynthesis
MFPAEQDTEVGMSAARKADVIVVVDEDTTEALGCVLRVLELGESILNRVIVVVDASVATKTAHDLEQLADADPRLSILNHAEPQGCVDSSNQGLSAREGDAVILSATSLVTPGWLSELASVAHSEERIACAAPLANLGVFHLQPDNDSGSLAAGATDLAPLESALSGLPRGTTSPTVDGPCVYFRSEMIDAVGLLDPSLATLASALDDWVIRAQALGFCVIRANHAIVHQSGLPAGSPGQNMELDRGRTEVLKRRPQSRIRVEGFNKTVDAHLARHAAGFHRTGKLTVAFDLRHIPAENVGTRTYAVNLGKALSALPEIEFTLLVRIPIQADGLEGRVVREEDWEDDVAVIHKPAQVFDRRELALLFGSSAHVVITYQDLIAYRIPDVFSSEREHQAYRTTSSLSVQAAQGILAYSESSALELTTEFGVPRQEVAVTPLGVDAEWFAHRERSDAAAFRKLRLPRRYFFSLATDYPHKNSNGLLAAYALMRSRWNDGEPPALVLAGYSVGAGARLDEGIESESLPDGMIFLGPVSARELRILYQRALALVFPSLYEGFGLPPLEAMAAGSPVIAMRSSSIPEVGGDAVLYAEGLSAAALAGAMETLATSEAMQADLRDRGSKRATLFRWEKTARATFEVYRSAVLAPSERSLHARRMLREAILQWSEPASSGLSMAPDKEDESQALPRSVGVRNAWNALNVAVKARMRRELNRFKPGARRRSA